MTRDAFDYLGNKVSTLSEPDGVTWSESEWERKLAVFARPPLSGEEQLNEMLIRSVSQSRVWADEIIEEFKRENLAYFVQNAISNDVAILISLHVHHRMRAITIEVSGLTFTIDLLNLVISGDLETAFAVLSYMEPDDMSMPFHWFTQERIDSLKAKIAERVGL